MDIYIVTKFHYYVVLFWVMGVEEGEEEEYEQNPLS